MRLKVPVAPFYLAHPPLSRPHVLPQKSRCDGASFSNMNVADRRYVLTRHRHLDALSARGCELYIRRNTAQWAGVHTPPTLSMDRQSTKNPFSDEARILGKSHRPPKRLIVCCDGTWKASDHATKGDSSYQTNITRMCHALEDDGVLPDGSLIPQVVYYQAGVGTNIHTAMARSIVGVWTVFY